MQKKKFDTKHCLEETFDFLVHELDFKIIKSKEMPGFIEILYVNNLTGVKITFEYRESYLMIMLYKLGDGKFIENPVMIQNDTKLNGYSLEAFVLKSNPDEMIYPAYYYQDGKVIINKEFNNLQDYFYKILQRLKKYGSKVLKGDFSEFTIIDKIVKENIIISSKP